MDGDVTGELGTESTTGGSADPSLLLDIIGIPADDGPADAEGFACSLPITLVTTLALVSIDPNSAASAPLAPISPSAC